MADTPPRSERLWETRRLLHLGYPRALDIAPEALAELREEERRLRRRELVGWVLLALVFVGCVALELWPFFAF